jgi:hypothetical protein
VLVLKVVTKEAAELAEAAAKMEAAKEAELKKFKKDQKKKYGAKGNRWLHAKDFHYTGTVKGGGRLSEFYRPINGYSIHCTLLYTLCLVCSLYSLYSLYTIHYTLHTAHCREASGWTEHETAHEILVAGISATRLYYYNEFTKESTWKIPALPDEEAEQKEKEEAKKKKEEEEKKKNKGKKKKEESEDEDSEDEGRKRDVGGAVGRAISLAKFEARGVHESADDILLRSTADNMPGEYSHALMHCTHTLYSCTVLMHCLMHCTHNMPGALYPFLCTHYTLHSLHTTLPRRSLPLPRCHGGQPRGLTRAQADKLTAWGHGGDGVRSRASDDTAPHLFR